MAYIPKNQIVTNQYTTGGEFVIKSTSSPYQGSYWKKSDGTFYTGKNPNELPSVEIIPVSETIIFPSDEGIETYTMGGDFDSLSIEENLISTGNGYTYAKLIKDPGINIVINTPQSVIVPPTDNDYTLGSYTRYMLSKINDFTFLEVTKGVYNKIISHDALWVWELYTPFTIPWVLTGEEDYVYKTNGNIVVLAEQRLGKTGLQGYFQNDYTQFYKKS